MNPLPRGRRGKILLNLSNFTNPTSIKTMSQLAQQRIREAKEKRSTRLDIGNCGLTYFKTKKISTKIVLKVNRCFLFKYIFLFCV